MEENTPQTGNNMSKMLIIGVVAIVALVGIGALMTRGNTTPTTSETLQQDQTTPETNETTSTTETPSENIGADEVKIINVEAGSFYYKPNEIRVKKGEKVRIVMQSVSMMHDFVIDELNVKMPITQNGTTGTVEFTADSVGEFEYYCSVGQHRQNGQIGTLIVEE